LRKSYTASQKKIGHFYDNFWKRAPIFHIFSLLNSESICGGSGIRTITSPTNLLPHYLVKSKWSTIQLLSTVNSVKSDEKYLTTVNFHGDAIPLLFYTD